MLSHVLRDSMHIDAEQMKALLDAPFYERWFAAVSGWAVAHPLWSALIVGALGMLVVFAFRRVLWNSVKWVGSIVAAPFAAAWRPVSRWRSARKRRRLTVGGASRYRLPIIGERSLIGPCRKCGTKREYTVVTTAYHGGSLRGYDTMTGKTVLGCAECART